MKASKDYEAVVRQAQKLGCQLVPGKSHRKLVTPSGAHIWVTGSRTSPRAAANLKATLRRNGVEVD